MEHITIYNGMGEPVREVEGKVRSRQWLSDGWDIASIETVDGDMLHSLYVRALPDSKIAAE